MAGQKKLNDAQIAAIRTLASDTSNLHKVNALELLGIRGADSIAVATQQRGYQAILARRLEVTEACISYVIRGERRSATPTKRAATTRISDDTS